MSYTKIQIKQCVENVKKWNPNTSSTIEEFHYIDLSSIDKEQKQINFVQKIKSNEAPSRARQLVQKNDILVSTVRPNLNGVALIESDYVKGTASTGYCILRAKPNLSYRYLYYWVQTSHFIKNMTNQASGASYPAVSDKIIKNSQIPLPPLSEQKRIAGILDKAEEVKRHTKALIKKYEELTQSLFLEMFGDPVLNPKEWEVIKLKDVCLKITDGTHQGPKFINSGIPFLLVSNIKNNKISFNVKKYISEEEYKHLTRTTAIEVGDLLYTSVGSYGNPAIVNDSRRFCFQRHIAHLKPKHDLINIIFFHSLMLSPLIKRQADKYARGVAQKTLNLKAIKEMKAILPPLPLQNQFAKRVAAIEAQKAAAEASLAKAEDLFNCLLQKAFKGELSIDN